MPILGQLKAAIGGGVLCIGDEEVRQDGLGDEGPHPYLGVGPTQLVLTVRNGDEGDTTVRMAGPSLDDPVGPIIFDGTVRVGSGRLRVGDVVDDSVVWIPVPAGELRVRLHVNQADPELGQEPDRVDIVLPDV